MSTVFPSKQGIERKWHLIDAENVVLGKLASHAARVLMGKNKAILAGVQPIVRRVDLGDQGTFYRLMAGSYASMGDAEAACIKLKEAGLDSQPGGGAEIFSDRVRRIICDHKLNCDEWLDTARTSHSLGLMSNCTMLYGHIETEEDRVDHQIGRAHV